MPLPGGSRPFDGAAVGDPAVAAQQVVLDRLDELGHRHPRVGQPDVRRIVLVGARQREIHQGRERVQNVALRGLELSFEVGYRRSGCGQEQPVDPLL